MTLLSPVAHGLAWLWIVKVTPSIQNRSQEWKDPHVFVLQSILTCLQRIIITAGKPVSWQDGSALVYSNWKSEAVLSKRRSEQPCPVMTGDEGKWNLVNCKTAYSRVICKTEASEYQGYSLKENAFLFQTWATTPDRADNLGDLRWSWFLPESWAGCRSAWSFPNLSLVACVFLRVSRDISGSGHLHLDAHRSPFNHWICNL